ncbi:MAG: chloride channel protein [Chloroflexota bacterium]|nr:chloride channel protein [Chloroflexota bacterium]
MTRLRVRTALIEHAYDWLRGRSTGLVVLALCVGVGAGVGAIGFRALIGAFTLVFTGQSDYGSLGRPVHPALPGLGIWFIVAVPVLGGLLYGPLIDLFAREARGHGVPEVMLAVAEQGGRIRPRVAVIKSLASAICLGSGGSVGREGPIVQIGSALGSGIGQFLRVGESNLRLLVACGAAGGISATFNAPIAGVFFALELILRDFEVRSFGVVVLASVAANVVSRAAFGSASFLPLPPFQIVSIWEYPLYALLGLAAAAVGVAFIRTLYGTEDLLDRLWGSRPEWLRPAVGGIVLGLLLLALPQLYGVGYAPLEQAIGGKTGLTVLLLLLAGKMLATSLTIGIGGSGGVFAPSLFLGGMLGTAFGVVVNALAPGLVAPAGAYGLVGMGAVFAGAARAPITAVLILFELTGDYQIILPLMLAIVISAGVSGFLSSDTIYTLKLRRRGIDIFAGRAANLMGLLTVRDAMRPVPTALPVDATLGEVLDRFAAEGIDTLPVVDRDGVYRGIVTSSQLEESMRTNVFDTTAADLVQSVPPVRADETLEQALERLLTQGAAGLPVLDADDGQVVGWLTHHDLLAAYSARLGGRVVPVSAGKPPRGNAAQREVRAALSWLSGYRIVEVEFTSQASPVGRRIADMAWPAFSLPLAVRRGGQVFSPMADTILSQGDRLTVLVARDAADDLDDRLVGLATKADEEPTPKDT